MTAWRPISEAPASGNFLAWHDGFGEVREVRLFTVGSPRAGTVINGPSGRFFVARWWMPKPDAPPEAVS
jgi:hypothetical protein